VSDDFDWRSLDCGWCGNKVNPALSVCDTQPRLGSIVFHYSCVDAAEYALGTLAANLGIAGALAKSFLLGRVNGVSGPACWHPGHALAISALTATEESERR
jgi:hypothetical protein